MSKLYVYDAGVVVAVVVICRVDEKQSGTQSNQQYYANKCVLKSFFGDAVHTRDLKKSGTIKEHLCTKLSGKTKNIKAIMS